MVSQVASVSSPAGVVLASSHNANHSFSFNLSSQTLKSIGSNTSSLSIKQVRQYTGGTGGVQATARGWGGLCPAPLRGEREQPRASLCMPMPAIGTTA